MTRTYSEDENIYTSVRFWREECRMLGGARRMEERGSEKRRSRSKAGLGAKLRTLEVSHSASPINAPSEAQEKNEGAGLLFGLL